MTALHGFDYAAAALSYFPYDGVLQLAMCKLIRNRCVDRIGRIASSQGQAKTTSVELSSQASVSSSGSQSVRLEMKTPQDMNDMISR